MLDYSIIYQTCEMFENAKVLHPVVKPNLQPVATVVPASGTCSCSNCWDTENLQELFATGALAHAMTACFFTWTELRRVRFNTASNINSFTNKIP